MIEHDDHKGINSGLGELPPSIRRERGETYEGDVFPQGPNQFLTQIPGSQSPPNEPTPMMPSISDVRGQNLALDEAQKTPFGLPAVDFLVQTTFDARPINGNDFQFFNLAVIDPDGDVGAPVLFADATFTVPQGRIAILRNIEWFPNELFTPAITIDPASTTIIDTSPVFITLFVAGAIPITYEAIYEQQGERPCYFIAQENETIVMRVTRSSPALVYAYPPHAFFMKMTGNLLQSRGREKIFEPANQYVGGLLK